MNIYAVRQALRSSSIYDLELRVVFYARVSTEREEQKTSIVNQNDYFEDYIRSQRKWRYVGKYIDEGISGINVDKRESFLKMIGDAKAGKFDLILTKEISRFARNTLDSIQYTRELLNAGIAVWFQNDNINTIDEDSELRLTIMSGIAQDESRKLSSRVRFGHARSIKNGVVLGNSMIYGWDKDRGKLVINEEEAEMVRTIFLKYSSGLWSTSTIADYLWDKGYRNRKGERIDRGVIKSIIKNPKYKGFYVGNKVKIIDMYTKKQKFLDESEWIMYKDDGSRVPALIDEETWEKANQIMEERGNQIRKRRTSYKKDNVFTGKIVCMEDGAKYWLKMHTCRGSYNPNWVCSHRIKEGVESCKSFPLQEKRLKEVLALVFNYLISNKTNIISYTIKQYEMLNQNLPDNEEKIAKIKREIEVLKQKKDKILDFNLEGRISDDEFIKRNEQFSQEIEEKENLIEKIDIKPVDEEELKKSLAKLIESVKECAVLSADDITQFVVQETIDCIKVNPVDANSAELFIFFKCTIQNISCIKVKYSRDTAETFEPEMAFFLV